MEQKTLEKFLKYKLNIEIFNEIDSTNNYLKKKGSQGDSQTILCVADTQTGGRGRMGRSFFSPSESGAYFSLLLHPDISAEKSLLLTVMAAVSVAETIKRFSESDVKIKWVNDIYIDGKKVCGILTEGSLNSEKKLDYAVVGIGINVFSPEKDFPDEIKNTSVSVFPGKSEKNIKEKIVAEVINRFLDMYYNSNDTSFIKKYKDHSYLDGKEINIISGDTLRPATAIGITESCHLLVKNENGEIEEISSGDVSVRLR